MAVISFYLIQNCVWSWKSGSVGEKWNTVWIACYCKIINLALKNPKDEIRDFRWFFYCVDPAIWLGKGRQLWIYLSRKYESSFRRNCLALRKISFIGFLEMQKDNSHLLLQRLLCIVSVEKISKSIWYLCTCVGTYLKIFFIYPTTNNQSE